MTFPAGGKEDGAIYFYNPRTRRMDDSLTTSLPSDVYANLPWNQGEIDDFRLRSPTATKRIARNAELLASFFRRIGTQPSAVAELAKHWQGHRASREIEYEGIVRRHRDLVDKLARRTDLVLGYNQAIMFQSGSPWDVHYIGRRTWSVRALL